MGAMKEHLRQSIDQVAQDQLTGADNPVLYRGQKETTPNMFAAIAYNQKFLDALQGLQSYVLDTNADIDMAYDWVCEMAQISTFVADNMAWDMFYDVYSDAIA